jgi:glycosyltransferase involved in cell wall biosynthesis
MADMCAALTRVGWRSRHWRTPNPEQSIQRRDPAGFDVTLAACHGQLLYAPLSPTFPFLLKRTLADFRPDLLHLHLPNTSAFFTLLSPAARRLPWVVHWHADIPLDTRHHMLRLAYGAYRPWERAMLRRANAIIATSQPYRDSSAALASWLEKTHVIPLGIADSSVASDWIAATAGDSPLFNPRPSDLSPPLRILAVGRLSYFKGIDVLLRAIADVAEATLLVIGDGECRSSLEQQARSLGIEPRVHFAGRVDMDAAGEKTLRAAYEDADVFCLPSTDRAESFGLVLLEAMRARLPAIASAIAGSGVGFVVRDGETGLLVPPGDAAALANALRQLAADSGLRARMGAAGAQRWQQEFTLDRAADRVLQLYEQVLAAKPVHA